MKTFLDGFEDRRCIVIYMIYGGMAKFFRDQQGRDERRIRKCALESRAIVTVGAGRWQWRRRCEINIVLQ
jgi:hypothetical protein